MKYNTPTVAMPEFEADTYDKDTRGMRGKAIKEAVIAITIVIVPLFLLASLQALFIEKCPVIDVFSRLLPTIAVGIVLIGLVCYTGYLCITERFAQKQKARQALKSDEGQKVWQQTIRDANTPGLSEFSVECIWQQYKIIWLRGTELESEFAEVFQNATGRKLNPTRQLETGGVRFD